jgi:hypothetical protein
MSYTLERLDNPAAYVVTFNEDFDFKDDIVRYHRELSAALDEEPSPVSMIVDTSKIAFDLAEFLGGTRAAMQAEVNPNHHPNSKHLILVTTSKVLKMSVDGFKKFGLVRTVYIASDLDEALNIARGNHSKNESA